MDEHGPAVLLVDDHHGMYALSALVSRYPLFLETGVALSPAGKKDLAGPDGLEAWDHLYPIRVEVCGKMWRVEWHDGALWAVHPDAEWDDETDWYTMGRDEDE